MHRVEDLQLALAFKLNGAPFDSGAQATPFAQNRNAALNLTVAGLDLAPLPRLPARLADGVQLHAVRDAGGRINLLNLAGQGGGAVPVRPATLSASAVTPAPAARPEAAWQVAFDALELVDARVLWIDAAVAATVALQLDGLALSAKQMRWPVAQAVPLSLSGRLRVQGVDAAKSAPDAGRFEVQGSATDRWAQVELKLAELVFEPFAPYIAQFSVPRVQASATVQAQLDWSGAAEAPRLKLGVPSASVDALRVTSTTSRTTRTRAIAPWSWRRTSRSSRRLSRAASVPPEAAAGSRREALA